MLLLLCSMLLVLLVRRRLLLLPCHRKYFIRRTGRHLINCLIRAALRRAWLLLTPTAGSSHLQHVIRTVTAIALGALIMSIVNLQRVPHTQMRLDLVLLACESDVWMDECVTLCSLPFPSNTHPL